MDAGYWVWTHVDGRWLYVAAAHYSNAPKIMKYDLDNGGAFVTSWGTKGTGPGQFGVELHGIDTDANGNVYVADADRRMVHVFTSTGTWLRDFGQPGGTSASSARSPATSAVSPSTAPTAGCTS